MQAIYDISEICYRKGVDTIVISPGSRSAPLVIAFARHQGIEKHIVLDERCAAYMAFGMALTSGKTVALLCTSGTAALNFAPAIAEAFYLNIPLLVLTADRPQEWVDQADGQTIRQQHLYGRHVKQFYQLPSEYSRDSSWFINRTLNEAINLSQSAVKGPVHINIPLKEPLYPDPEANIVYSEVRIIQPSSTYQKFHEFEWNKIKEEFNSAEKKLLVLGQLPYQPDFVKELSIFLEGTGIPLVADVTANAHFLDKDFIRHQDIFLADHLHNENLQPDLLISLGGPLVSKQLKMYLRENKPQKHWHIAEGDSCPDTFGALTRHLPVTPYEFFRKANRTASGLDIEKNEAFFDAWHGLNKATSDSLHDYLKNLEHSDFATVYNILNLLPEQTILHVANSMPIRYVNFIGLNKKTEVHSNRGTSGIDGCISTAIGAAHKSDKTVILLIGDLAFFYDSNALFQDSLPSNLKIIVLNNMSGNIFKMIEGPAQLPESKKYFETSHKRSVKFITEGYGIPYIPNLDSIIHTQLAELFNTPSFALLEVITEASVNVKALKGFSEYRKSNQLKIKSN